MENVKKGPSRGPSLRCYCYYFSSLLEVVVLRHEVLQGVWSVSNAALEGLDDLTHATRTEVVGRVRLIEIGQILSRQVGECLERRRSLGRSLHRRRQSRVGEVTNVEAGARYEERLTGGVVVRCVDPASAPVADAPCGGLGRADADHLVKRLRRNFRADTQRLPL